MGGVREELESIRRGFEPGGGIVAEYGSEVLEDLELENPKVGIVRAELQMEVVPEDDLRARNAGGPDGAPGEPGIEVDLERRAQLLNDVHVDWNRPSGELIEE